MTTATKTTEVRTLLVRLRSAALRGLRMGVARGCPGCRVALCGQGSGERLPDCGWAVASGGATRLVRSFAEGLLAVVSCPRPPAARYNTPAFTLQRTADDYAAMGGVDFAIGAPFSPLPGRSYWFWPEGRWLDGRRIEAHVHQPRYADPLAAVAASIRMHPAAVTDGGPLGAPEAGAEWSVFCMAQRSPDLRAAAHYFSGRVCAWFDDVDEGLAPGAARAWFLAGVAALPSPPPVLYRSDEWL